MALSHELTKFYRRKSMKEETKIKVLIAIVFWIVVTEERNIFPTSMDHTHVDTYSIVATGSLH